MAIAMITSTTLNSCQLMDSRLENPSPVAHSGLCLQNRPRFQRLSVVVCASPLQNQSSAYLERRLVKVFHEVLEKNEEDKRKRLELSFAVGTHLIPHPDKAEKGGEDALLVSNYNGGVLAVADGVSGWAEDNVDPAIFPRELMANAVSAIGDDKVSNDPLLLLQKAHATTCSVGSATVIVAMLEKNGTLKIANVGDCGLRILRQGQVVFSTSPQEHYFDCPFQLSSEIGGQTYKDAVVHSIEVMEGDTVVMGSDGLFDNVFDHEIESVVNSYEVSDLIVAKKTAKALADLANEHARDTEFESPYCLEARIQGHDVPIWKKLLGMKLTGGKLDDITVIVGTVVNARVLPQGSIHLDGDKYLPDAFPYNGEPESLLEGRPLTNEVPSNINDPYQESAGIP